MVQFVFVLIIGTLIELVLRTTTPPPSLTKSLIIVLEALSFPSWMAFQAILPSDQHKMSFIFPWGTSACRKLPFGIKNDGATF